MGRARSNDVKDIVDALEEQFKSLRKASDELEKHGIEVSHQTLSNWRAGKSKELNKLFQFLKIAQKVLNKSDSEMYRKAVKK